MRSTISAIVISFGRDPPPRRGSGLAFRKAVGLGWLLGDASAALSLGQSLDELSGGVAVGSPARAPCGGPLLLGDARSGNNSPICSFL